MPRRPFLTARWEHLVLLNYAVDPALLGPLVPAGTELDGWEGRTLASLVGFRFVDTRLLGVRIPRHRDFEEVNLRFYVRRRGPDGAWRRAVVFIRELVPRWAIATLARLAYNEPYLAVPMSHQVQVAPAVGGTVSYGWRFRGAAYSLSAGVSGPALPLEPGSEAEFVTEHYWGYTRQRDGGTLEYQVEHPRWAVWTSAAASFTGPSHELYGADFGRVLAGPPDSAFVAVGSPVAVHHGVRLPVARVNRVEAAINQPACCERASWVAELDLGHAGGFEYILGKCAVCGAVRMNVFCVATGITGFETVSSSDVERMKSIPAGPELKALMRKWGEENV